MLSVPLPQPRSSARPGARARAPSSNSTRPTGSFPNTEAKLVQGAIDQGVPTNRHAGYSRTLMASAHSMNQEDGQLQRGAHGLSALEAREGHCQSGFVVAGTAL